MSGVALGSPPLLSPLSAAAATPPIFNDAPNIVYDPDAVEFDHVVSVVEDDEDSWNDKMDDMIDTCDKEGDGCDRSGRQKRSSLTFFKDHWRDVNVSAVFSDLRNDKVLTFALTRDIFAFLVNNIALVLVHNLLWNGEISTGTGTGRSSDQVDEQEYPYGDPQQNEIPDRAENRADTLSNGAGLLRGPVNNDVLINTYLNPKIVLRNLIIVTSVTAFTWIPWYVPSILWPYTDLAQQQNNTREPAPVNTFVNDVELSTELGVSGRSLEAESRQASSSPLKFLGPIGSFINVGLADVYNRVLCPTCVVQIVIFNTIRMIGQLFFWTFFPIILSTLGLGG